MELASSAANENASVRSAHLDPHQQNRYGCGAVEGV